MPKVEDHQGQRYRVAYLFLLVAIALRRSWLLLVVAASLLVAVGPSLQYVEVADNSSHRNLIVQIHDHANPTPACGHHQLTIFI